jgi:uncharacterized membrane protein
MRWRTPPSASAAQWEMLRAVGEFVSAGAALFRVTDGDSRELPDGDVRRALGLGRERSHEQDVGFRLRQLVDVACRALSPGISDPTTAVQALDQLHDLVRRLAARPLPAPQMVRWGDRTLVVIPEPAFDDYLDLAVDEIHHWGRDDPRIRRRLRGLLVDVHTAARPEQRGAIVSKLGSWGERTLPDPDVDLTPSDLGLRSAMPPVAAGGELTAAARAWPAHLQAPRRG